jgi:hypothetical protein
VSDSSAPPKWQAPPPEVTWDLNPPIVLGVATFRAITLRAPLGEDVLKATAVRGASNMEVTMRLIATINAEGIPFEAVVKLPAWIIEQMSGYIDSFGGAPPPLPLRRVTPLPG